MQKLELRLIHTHDVQSKWEKLESFIPTAGEVIVYDIDDNFSYERFKIGDGKTPLKNLPFTVDKSVESLFSINNNIIYADAGRITDYKEKTDA